MYKGNSRALQRAHGVGRISAATMPGDALPPPETLELPEALQEKARLQGEVARIENQLTAAKRGNWAEAQALGQRKASIQGRLSAVNARIKQLNRADDDRMWRLAVSEVCPELYDRLVERKIALSLAARGQK